MHVTVPRCCTASPQRQACKHAALGAHEPAVHCAAAETIQNKNTTEPCSTCYKVLQFQLAAIKFVLCPHTMHLGPRSTLQPQLLVRLQRRRSELQHCGTCMCWLMLLAQKYLRQQQYIAISKGERGTTISYTAATPPRIAPFKIMLKQQLKSDRTTILPNPSKTVSRCSTASHTGNTTRFWHTMARNDNIRHRHAR